ncbi:MAG: MATE family efflux transporter [Lachnospiraceae bacterium]|nr:MATE family efflux transporter [Lachnospiraceae bacterium]
MAKTVDLSSLLRNNGTLSTRSKISLAWTLSVPAILSQLTSIVMQYSDAAMVGSLGASATAAIGVTSTTIWLFGNLYNAACYGYSVQIANAVGAGDASRSRRLFRQGLTFNILFSLFLMLIGLFLSRPLPGLLGADASLFADATAYFMVYSLTIPLSDLRFYGSASLQSSGNMRIPGILNSLACLLNIVFNFLMIFPTRQIVLGNYSFICPGMGFGVMGAALGTTISEGIIACIMLLFAFFREPYLSGRGNTDTTAASSCITRSSRSVSSYIPTASYVKRALQIGTPYAVEQCTRNVALILITMIITPLGTIAVAANSLAVTAEALCYMPAVGLSAAATTLVGQSIGAGRKDYAKSFAWITTFFGMILLTITGILMFFLCPFVFSILTPVPEVQALCIRILRVELISEPLFAASLVISGALRGAGDTLIPCILALGSVWGVRLTLSLLLVGPFGLTGIWIAMCIELCVRGLLFLIRLGRGKWLNRPVH